MRAWSRRSPSAARRVALALAMAGAAIAAGNAPRPLPPVVFVSRVPPTGADAGQVPGLGPHGTFAGAGGRLLERSPDGTIRELVAPVSMFDVADPAPSPDGRRVAFSGRSNDRAAWRIWVVDRTSGALTCESCAWDGSFGDETDGGRSMMLPADHADPAWWGETLLFVAAPRGPHSSALLEASLYDGGAVPQLYAIPPEGGIHRLTSEPNGVLDPVPDAARHRLLFSRWWFNPWSPDSAGHLARGGSLRDSVNAWQVVSARLEHGSDGRPVLVGLRLAAGGVLPRRRGMGLQATLLPNGNIVAVAARNTGLAPRPGTLALLRFRGLGSAGTRIAGAAIGDDSDDPYTENANLLAPAACAPAALPDGRLLYSLDPGGRGDFGVWLMSANERERTKLVDLPGTWELDAAAVPARASARATPRTPAASEGKVRGDAGGPGTFRYLATDVFAGHGAAPRKAGARLHVYRILPPDSLERLESVAVPWSGRVDLRLPASTPLFELLTDSTGRVLMSAHGATQVRGFNSGAPGTTARCSGCHLGHSARR